MNADDITNDADESPINLRSGMMVRVVNPNSPHYGNTGHLLGRNEQLEPYWIVRFTTTATTVHLLEEDVVLVR